MIIYTDAAPAPAVPVNVFAIIEQNGATVSVDAVWTPTDPGPPVVPGTLSAITATAYATNAANGATDGVPIVPALHTVLPGPVDDPANAFWPEIYALINAALVA